MHLVVGLGNPGSSYEGTRHNIGFMALTALAQKHEFPEPTRFKKSLIAKKSLKGQPLLLAWPQTYMNLSGEAVAELLAFYKLEKSQLLVLHDELDLPLGRLKLAKDGGSAGHNGINSIVGCCGADFARLKMGITRPSKEAFPGSTADYVLGTFNEPEKETLAESILLAKKGVELWLKEGLTKAQNLVNKPPKKTAPASLPAAGENGA